MSPRAAARTLVLPTRNAAQARPSSPRSSSGVGAAASWRRRSMLPPEDGETFAENALGKARAAVGGDRRRTRSPTTPGSPRPSRSTARPGRTLALASPAKMRQRRGEPRPAPGRARGSTKMIAASPMSVRWPSPATDGDRARPTRVECEGLLDPPSPADRRRLRLRPRLRSTRHRTRGRALDG